MSRKLRTLLAGARAALSQNATFPADVAMAKRCINDALAELDEGFPGEELEIPDDTPSLENCDDYGTGEGRYHGRM